MSKDSDFVELKYEEGATLDTYERAVVLALKEKKDVSFISYVGKKGIVYYTRARDILPELITEKQIGVLSARQKVEEAKKVLKNREEELRELREIEKNIE